MAAASLVAGCSSTPMSGGDDAAQVTTGSLGASVQVQQPLPPTLAYSDASKIGETAAGALSQIAVDPSAEWVNASTGSSGTVVAGADTAAAPAESSTACKLFQTIVTSFKGVHQYSGTICAGADGRTIMRIEEPSLAPAPAPQVAATAVPGGSAAPVGSAEAATLY